MSDGRCWVHGGKDCVSLDDQDCETNEVQDQPDIVDLTEFVPDEAMDLSQGGLSERDAEANHLSVADPAIDGSEIEQAMDAVEAPEEKNSEPSDEPALELAPEFEFEEEIGTKDIETAVEEARAIDLSDLAELLIEDVPVDGESDEVERVTPRDKTPDRFFDSDTQDIEPDVKFSVSKAADGKGSQAVADGKDRLPHRKVAGNDGQAVSFARPDVSLSDEGKTSFLRQRIGIPVPLLMAVLVLTVSALVAGTILSGGETVGDAGSLKFKALDIISQTVENETAGSLFVISGQVKSSYDHRRSAVRISGTLFTKGNFSKSETVFCGNILSDKALIGSDLEAIMLRLQKKAGDNNKNGRIDSGATLPFMIVFSDLPDDLKMLDRYTVEVVGSDGP